jgi:hypothetical protein
MIRKLRWALRAAEPTHRAIAELDITSEMARRVGE